MNKLWQTIESRERVRESISKHAQALPIGIRHSQQGKFRYEHGSPHSWGMVGKHCLRGDTIPHAA